jgi:diaminohydroxyphosphoribosylaminopyrimidine deaminase/5-amino-6-(5-phosphoribosylamino)uracil reductase
MANQRRNKYHNKHLKNLSLAFELAKINLGSTNENPSVGCVVERDGSIISSGYTSINGRPHAEYNALKKKLDFRNSNIYITLEPCSHYGKTPPCTNIIKQKGIKKVFYAINDFDKRSKNKSKKVLQKKDISINNYYFNKKGLKFYESYYRLKSNKLPLIDAKIALSKDNFTKNKKNRWITNKKSRKLSHLLRTKYNALLSTSKTINEDNSILNCRINGLGNKSPNLIILDRNLNIRKNLKIFKLKTKRKIFIYTTNNNKNKINWFKRKNIKVFIMKKMSSKDDFTKLFKSFIKLNFSRIFI